MALENDSSYTPVAYEYREIIQELIEQRASGKIFFWSAEQTVDEVIGQVVKLEELPGKGTFITLDSGAQVRIDRIITIFGKPGAGYDEYDSFANQCLSCTAGVPL
jgi:hypothetical protein